MQPLPATAHAPAASARDVAPRPVPFRLRPRAIVLAAIALSALVAAWWGFTIWRAHPYVFDDAFISFRYAYNLAHGRGLVYNPGERVEGYTNFLWTVLAALALKAKRDPLVVMQALGVASYLATIASCGLVLSRVARSRLRDAWLALVPPLLVLPTLYPGFAGTGLETPFVALLALGVGAGEHLIQPRSRAMRVARACVPLACVLTRLDAAIFVAASALVTTWSVLWARRGPWAAVRELFGRFGLCGAGVALWLAWKWRYYGELLPNTYYAKAADLLNVEQGKAYLRAFAESYPHVLVLLPLAILGAFGRRERRFAAWAALSLLGFVAYMLRVGADFMYYRFAFEVYPIYVCLAAFGLLELLDRARVAPLLVAGVALYLAEGTPILETKYYMQSMSEMDGYYRVGERIAAPLGRRLPRYTVISTTLAGTMSYFADLETIDEWGLNDRFVAHQHVAMVTQRGHVKRAPRDYLVKRGVNLVFGHPGIVACSTAPHGGAPTVYTRIAGDECTPAEYLVQRPELTRYLCEHPDDFILRGISCP